MLKIYPADFHIHTCLSPCADDEMIPINILNMARLMGTKILGICDHNSAKNLEPFTHLAKNYKILILPGIEVQSREEVHILCLFSDIEATFEFQEYIYENMPYVSNNPKYFGHQWIVDERGNIKEEESRLLIMSTDLKVDEISLKSKDLGGIMIPAHVDKKSFSIISQLGMIPKNLNITALEISRNISVDKFREKFPELLKYNLVMSSDAHRLEEMVFQKTFFYIKDLSFNEVKLALMGVGGRKVVIRDNEG